MSDEERINPDHLKTRQLLRKIGPLIFGVGVLFTIVGMGSFFMSFGSFGSPRYFWCCFVGMPLMFVGSTMSGYGFMGAITRYQAGEIAPVGKDTFNYMAEETRGGVQAVASAIGAGLNQSARQSSVACPSCGTANDSDAKFCDSCGTAMLSTCGSCGAVNDSDAKFCDRCGTQLSQNR
ncbi:Double zinc ribbon [Rosistilla ulvae]|uniref:Double zinc ribbon n=1 Tax=Rosistilla ulvae TaxID=1930277 RepID=A0A517LV94_9BACT|nr:zinc ribbon domain-containing protein [Rosistilla ulvae]QDS86545.1 Double zinc ribbon [Rosistilla ulvae]